MYNVRSNVGTLSSVTPVMNTCLMSGSVARAASPRQPGLVGTVRRWVSDRPSRSISSIMIERMSCWQLASFGRNTKPVPYFPFSGTGMP